jgi:hypothetical protein
MTVITEREPTRARRDGEPVVKRRALRSLKRTVRTMVPAPTRRRHVLAIVGCQRSGTTMLQQSLLDRSWRVIVLGEMDPKLTQRTDPETLRWKPLSEVAPCLRALPFELVVTKPLVESHRTTELLDALPDSRAIWMLRHYLAVATSNLAKFGINNGHRDLERLVSGDRTEWRASCTSDVRERVRSLMAAGISDLDAAALFWWARNQLYFDQNLMRDDRVRVLRYESVVNDPVGCVEVLSKFIGVTLRSNSGERAIRQSGRVKERLQPQVERLCAEMLERFSGVPELRPHHVRTPTAPS